MLIIKGRTLGKSTPASVRSLMRARIYVMQQKHSRISNVIPLKLVPNRTTLSYPLPMFGIPRGQAAVFCSTVNYFKAPI